MPVFPNFIFERRGRSKIWLDRSYADPAFIDLMADPDQLFETASCDVLKDQRKIKVGKLAIRIAGIEHRIYLKRYNALRYANNLGRSLRDPAASSHYEERRFL
jgi:hypothetical protein